MTRWVALTIIALGLLFMASDLRAINWQKDENAIAVRCGKPCVIQYSPGGVIDVFRKQALRFKNSKTWVIIDGPCASACTLLADDVRPRVCITSRAVFLFHKGMVVDQDGRIYRRFDIQYSPDLQQWINSKGGLPADGFLVLDNTAAQAFFPRCLAD